jgi:hypothetical protein
MPADRISGDGDVFGARHSLVKLSPLLAVERLFLIECFACQRAL